MSRERSKGEWIVITLFVLFTGILFTLAFIQHFFPCIISNPSGWYSQCGDNPWFDCYKVGEESCCNGRIIEGSWEQCGGDCYNFSTQFCCGSEIYSRNSRYACCNTTVFEKDQNLICCGGTLYELNGKYSECCGQDYCTMEEKCCGPYAVNPKCYDPDDQTCFVRPLSS